MAVSEYASVDEAAPIDIGKERKKKHAKRQQTKILKTLTLIKLEKKLIQQNGGQSMRFYMKLISKIPKFSLMILL